MRVIEPHHLHSRVRIKPGIDRKYTVIAAALLVAAVLLGSVGYYLYRQQSSSQPRNVVSGNNAETADETAIKPKNGTLKTFTPQQFRDLYNNFAYPNTVEIKEKTPITNNEALDTRIRSIADSKGYKARSAPVADTFMTVAPGMQLQQRASQPWLDLQSAASKEGIRLSLSAAYRSADDQREIFLSRFGPRQAFASQVSAGDFDQQITTVLARTAPPGYSRHHTGFTVDLDCNNNPNARFENTVCFKWLEANNYANAKRFGWIPSYPEGTGQQGPEPESWEYVWVGTETVTE